MLVILTKGSCLGPKKDFKTLEISFEIKLGYNLCTINSTAYFYLFNINRNGALSRTAALRNYMRMEAWRLSIVAHQTTETRVLTSTSLTLTWVPPL